MHVTKQDIIQYVIRNIRFCLIEYCYRAKFFHSFNPIGKIYYLFNKLNVLSVGYGKNIYESGQASFILLLEI